MKILPNRFSSILGLTVLSSSLIFGITGCLNTTDTANDATEVIEVDVNMPMTGALGFFGENLKQGATMALEDIKNKSNEIQMKFDWQDNAGEQSKTVSVYQNQYLDKPDIYVSGLPVQNLAISDQVSSYKTPHFVWQFDTFINDKSDNIPDNRLRTLLNFKLESKVYADFIKSKSPQKVAIVYVNIPSLNEQFEKILKPQIEEMGAVLFIEPYEISLNDYKSLASKIRNFNPDVLILSGFKDNLVGLIRAVRPLGLIKENNTMSGYDLLDTATVLSPDELEGIHVTAPVFISRPNEGKAEEWIANFEEKYNKKPDYNSAYGYDMVSIIYDAAKRLDGQDSLPAKPEQWLKALASTNIEGVTGAIRFDDDGSIVTPMDLTVYRGGKLIVLKSFTFD